MYRDLGIIGMLSTAKCNIESLQWPESRFAVARK